MNDVADEHRRIGIHSGQRSAGLTEAVAKGDMT